MVVLTARARQEAIKMRALKHGAYTEHAFQRRAKMRELLRAASKLLKELS
jgi:hypothetical protein